MWWVIGYALIGLLSMCAVQYYKGRKDDYWSADYLDLLSWAVLFVWPGVIMVGVSIGILLCLCVPFWKLAEFCAELGKKHRGPKKHPMP